MRRLANSCPKMRLFAGQKRYKTLQNSRGLGIHPKKTTAAAPPAGTAAGFSPL
jgi:hypothetical protein